MKKYFIATVVALALALAAAPAANAAFTTYLTVGSTGADVSALQTWLINNGYAIPAISSGAASTGYFGQQTKAAVVKYQAAVGLPATGFVGPLTIAKLNGTAGVTMTPNPICPAGYTCTANPGTVTPGTVVPPTTWVADGMDGSVTLSTNSYVSSTQTLKKGDMDKPILSMTAKATAGSVNVNRFDVHFNSRPWLLFSRVTLKNALTGQVIAVKNLSSAADTTEVTVGTDYLVRFENVNAIVSPIQDVTFVVTADVLAASDKITGQTVVVSSDINGIRTINGKGFTDSTGLVISNSVVLSSTGSTGDLITRVGLTTPDTRTDNISTTNVTTDKILGVYDIKLQNQSGVINALNFTIASDRPGYNASTLFQNIRLYQGSTLLGGAYAIGTGNPGTVQFVNLNLPLAAEEWKSLTLKADVLATSSAFAASSTLVSSSVTGVDANYNTITLTNASSRTTNDVKFVANAGVTLQSPVFTKRTPTAVSTTNGQWFAAYPTFTFTLTNTGNNPIYISKTASVALATSTSAGPAASTTVAGNLLTASGSTSGDTSTSYIINGSRTFTADFTVDNTPGSTSAKKISITQINYGTAGGAGTDNTLNINYGLENAYINLP